MGERRFRSKDSAKNLPGLTAASSLLIKGKTIGNVAKELRAGHLTQLPAITRAYALHHPNSSVPRNVCEYVLLKIKSMTRSRVELVGSWRRGSVKPRDIDILTNAPLNRIDFSTIGTVLSIYANGDSKRSAIIQVNVSGHSYKVPIDIFHAEKQSWGTALLHFTGPATYNIRLRAHARKMGYKLNQYGLLAISKKNKSLKCYTQESQVLAFLNATWRPPNFRE